METAGENPQKEQGQGQRSQEIVSRILPDGRMVELVQDRDEAKTSFIIWDGEKLEETTGLRAGRKKLIPCDADNNLLTNGIVLFPSRAQDYESESELVKEVQAYLHRYVDLSPSFERLAAYYVLLTWVHDRFNELPYLRLRGDYGTGKTRFLLTLGSICYKGMFASGASSVSSVFHMLDGFGGTLLIDESDMRFSDQTADLVKILNNGNVRGIPVLRSEPTKDGRAFNPRAFQVFGPKVIAMRGHFQDAALESRFITETTGERRLRKDIPINLPPEQRREAEGLRNRLLMYRFRNFNKLSPEPKVLDAKLEPRLNQIYAPLAEVMQDEAAREDLRRHAWGSAARVQADRGARIEADVLTVIRALIECSGKGRMTVGDIHKLFMEAYGEEYGEKMSHKGMGYVVRRKLNLVTHKSDGIYGIPVSEMPKLEVLFEHYQVTAKDGQALLQCRGRSKEEKQDERDERGANGQAKEGELKQQKGYLTARCASGDL